MCTAAIIIYYYYYLFFYSLFVFIYLCFPPSHAAQGCQRSSLQQLEPVVLTPLISPACLLREDPNFLHGPHSMPDSSCSACIHCDTRALTSFLYVSMSMAKCVACPFILLAVNPPGIGLREPSRHMCPPRGSHTRRQHHRRPQPQHRALQLRPPRLQQYTVRHTGQPCWRGGGCLLLRTPCAGTHAGGRMQRT